MCNKKHQKNNQIPILIYMINANQKWIEEMNINT